MTVNLDTYKLGNKIQFTDCNDNSSERHYDKATQWNMMDDLLNFFDFIGDRNVIFRDVAWIGTREDVDRLVFDHEVGNYNVVWDVQVDNGWHVKIIIKNVYVESSTWTYELIVK